MRSLKAFRFRNFCETALEITLTRAETLQPNGALGRILSGKFENAARGNVQSLRWLFDNRINAPKVLRVSISAPA